MVVTPPDAPENEAPKDVAPNDAAADADRTSAAQEAPSSEAEAPKPTAELPSAASSEATPDYNVETRRFDGEIRGFLGILIALAQPILGALPAAAKYTLEGYASPKRFRASTSTVLNVLFNVLLYGGIGWIVARRLGSSSPAHPATIAGLALAGLEGIIRLARASDRSVLPHRRWWAAFYGWITGPWVWPILDALLRPIAQKHGKGPQPPEKPVPEGTVYVPDELEKRRRYGMVHSVAYEEDGYRIRLELPRITPPIAREHDPSLPETLPDYAIRVWIEDGIVNVEGRLDDPRFADAVNRFADFPGVFLTQFHLENVAASCRHEYDPTTKTLEVYVPRKPTSPAADEMGYVA